MRRKKNRQVIKDVVPGGIAQELGLAPGDVLLSINGQSVRDVLDYQYLCQDAELLVLVQKPDGEEWELEIEKAYDEDLGIVFENAFMDAYHSCRNKCIFCFIDQMPPGMRETLYFKDDDARLSFLQGNYITLTNLTEADMDQILRYHLSPIQISFHTTDPDLRVKMLNNRFAGEALKKVDRLYEAGIAMNGQIVLCKGINDGQKLQETLERLSGYLPHLQSVSVVPVGLTRYREGLYPLEPFEKKDARAVLGQIHRFQKEMLAANGTHFVYAADEWYLLAGQQIPEAGAYDGYPQLENGVGMLRLFLDEAAEELAARKGDARAHRLAVATGVLSAPAIASICRQIQEKYPRVELAVYPLQNHFFGAQITVSGLLVGQDVVSQLAGKDLGDGLLLPCNLFRSGQEVFLDDMTRADVEKALQTNVGIVKSSGKDFVRAALLEEQSGEAPAHGYEVNGFE